MIADQTICVKPNYFYLALDYELSYADKIKENVTIDGLERIIRGSHSPISLNLTWTEISLKNLQWYEDGTYACVAYSTSGATPDVRYMSVKVLSK